MNKHDITLLIGKPLIDVFLCGSRETCNPIPTNTDIDYMILVKPNCMFGVNVNLEVSDFDLGGSLVIDERTINRNLFWSFTKGDLNLLITEDINYFNKFKQATALAKSLNLLDKGDRITLFQAVLYDNFPETTQPIPIPL